MEALVRGDGYLGLRGQVWRCALGRGGIRVDKREGDGATPTGLLPLRRVLYRLDRLRPPLTTAPLEPIARSDGWCDASGDPAYNRPIALPYSGHYEALWRQDAVYDIVGVLGWNDDPVRNGLGSAIFLHVARADYAPTEGCIALALPDLTEVLAAGLSAIRVDPQAPG